MRKAVRSDRFKAIVEAYGVNPRRWPEHEREGALEFMNRHPEKAGDLMRDAVVTDEYLGALINPHASDSLHWETLAHMMPFSRAEVMTFVPKAAKPSPRFWLATGFGLAAACAAGIVFGVNLGLMSTTELRVEEVLASSSMIEVDNW